MCVMIHDSTEPQPLTGSLVWNHIVLLIYHNEMTYLGEWHRVLKVLYLFGGRSLQNGGESTFLFLAVVGSLSAKDSEVDDCLYFIHVCMYSLWIDQ